MKKRKIMALLMSFAMVCSLTACGGKDTGASQPEPAPAPADNTAAPDTSANQAEPAPADAAQAADITLWTYPVGNWGDSATVDALIANFNAAYPRHPCYG